LNIGNSNKIFRKLSVFAKVVNFIRYLKEGKERRSKRSREMMRVVGLFVNRKMNRLTDDSIDGCLVSYECMKECLDRPVRLYQLNCESFDTNLSVLINTLCNDEDGQNEL